ncbi:MAG TPA: PRC-barrel domain-containing protein [Acetobacteraceae bacterium]|nr:PRC-barrel domain-containing protein [Acetobacteraceae bacterium]
MRTIESKSPASRSRGGSCQGRKRAALCVAALLAGAASPAFAADRTHAAPPEFATPQSSPWISVIAANEIIGRRLIDPRGQDIGRIENILLDLNTGRASYLVVAPAGALGEDGRKPLLPISVVRLTSFVVTEGSRDVRASVSGDTVAKAPGLDRDNVADLVRPETAAAIATYYGIAPDPHAGAQPARLVLVDHDAVFSLPPSSGLPVAIRDMAVRHPAKGEIGDIDRVIIDPESHRVVYLLIAQGGFLGLGGTWTPVPLQALDWSDQDRAFVLRAGPPAEGWPALRKESLPDRVHRDELRRLYERFGTVPDATGMETVSD